MPTDDIPDEPPTINLGTDQVATLVATLTANWAKLNADLTDLQVRLTAARVRYHELAGVGTKIFDAMAASGLNVGASETVDDVEDEFLGEIGCNTACHIFVCLEKLASPDLEDDTGEAWIVSFYGASA